MSLTTIGALVDCLNVNVKLLTDAINDARAKLDAMSERLAKIEANMPAKGLTVHVNGQSLEIGSGAKTPWVQPAGPATPLVASRKPAMTVRATNGHKPRGDRPPKHLPGYSGRSELPPSKPEHATVPPWDGPNELTVKGCEA